MANVEFKLNRQGVRELLTSEEMKSVCESYASSTVSSLGDGYNYDSYIGKNRARATVRASSREAERDNSENNSMLKAVGGKS